MSVNWAMWEAIGTISATVVALFFGLYSLFQMYFNRPNIVLEHNDSDIANTHRNVDTYYLHITNKGRLTAKQVNVRALEIKQGDTQLHNLHERYHIFKSLTIQHGDTFSTNFIQNHIDADFFMTPAGRDKLFSREKTSFKFLISGDNFQSYEKTIVVEPIESDVYLKISL